MPVSDMRALRTLYARRHILRYTSRTHLSPPFLLSCKPSLNPSFSRHFLHTSARLLSSDSWGGSLSWGAPPDPPNEPNPSVVSAYYDPLSGEIVTGEVSEETPNAEEACSGEVGGWKEDRATIHPAAPLISSDGFGSSPSWATPIDPSNEPNPGGISAIYDPVSGGLGTTRVADQNPSTNDKESRSSNVGSSGDARKDGTYGAVKGWNKQESEAVSFVNNKKKGKNKIAYVCSKCGHDAGQWWGYCRACKAVGSMTKFAVEQENYQGKTSGIEVSQKAVSSWLPEHAASPGPMRLTDVNRGINQQEWRIPMPGLLGNEVSRVLGGGLVPGSLVLVGGDPGVGKSTLLLQMAALIAEGYGVGEQAPVLYVSGEESVEQIGNRADRLRIGTEELFLYSSTDIEDILKKIQLLSPRALVVDSIQTAYIEGVTGSAGGLQQVKECTAALLRFAKKTKIPVLLTGHVTKTGEIAGPRVLEHIVDVVLYLEGEKSSLHRLLRPVKNRFGSIDELGVFEMSQEGLQAVKNPSGMFLSEQQTDSEVLAGLATSVIMDGSRTFLIEIQALCATGSPISRQVNGVQSNRADMIIAVLKKQAGLKLQDDGVLINVVSGVKLTDTAGDLAIAAAICSSFLEFPIPNNVAFIGEIGLAGELRPVIGMEKRVNTVAKLGYAMCIVPQSSLKLLETHHHSMEGGIKIIGCRNLKEVINSVFVLD